MILLITRSVLHIAFLTFVLTGKWNLLKQTDGLYKGLSKSFYSAVVIELFTSWVSYLTPNREIPAGILTI